MLPDAHAEQRTGLQPELAELLAEPPKPTPPTRRLRFSDRLKRKRRLLLLILAVLFLCSAVFTAYYGLRDYFTPVPEAPTTLITSDSPVMKMTADAMPGVLYPDDGQPDPADELPAGKLFATPERQLYKSADLRLVIPILSIDAPVYNGTDANTLLKGPCLYEVAQLPGRGNRNVSIAAHRNGYRAGKPTVSWFYYLDELKSGDYFYLCDSDKIYRYAYTFMVTVEENDWSQIYSQGYSCLTLTTCTPIGVADHRLIVRATLDEVFYNTEDFDFLAKSADAAKT
ncbi:MAG: class E sortase [Clostridiales Family XIII bacterium]|jgi:LPXTG-site transpeptidase (sortase) family protein|nr:class E sortase [Clostridiales Family XIII bacterium]